MQGKPEMIERILLIGKAIACLVIWGTVMGCSRHPETKAPRDSPTPFQSYLQQDREYHVYVGLPLNAPSRWSLADSYDESSVQVDGQRVEPSDVMSWLVVYQNGEVLDAERPFFPLPNGVHFIETREQKRKDILDLSQLREGRSFAKVTFGPSSSRPGEPGQYSTSIKNVSEGQFRVTKFAGYVKSGDVYVLNTVSGDVFSASQFAEWYGVDPDGWIKPGQTVTDPNNYGGGDGYWAYHCETDHGHAFIAGARIPE